MSCEIFTARSSLVNIYEHVSVKVSVCAMTTHPSHTLQEVETGLELAVGLGAGGGQGHGAPQAPLSGSLCAYSALPMGLQTCTRKN